MEHLTDIITAITRSSSRKHLYHMTRVTNLAHIALTDKLLASSRMVPQLSGTIRDRPVEVAIDAYTVTVNAHLRIPEAMMAPGISRAAFHAYLDKHVFCWPTKRDCRYMIDSYGRREPSETVAVMELEAASLLMDHGRRVKLSRYDSGSAPRYPGRCSYRKSPAMFVRLESFGRREAPWVPTIPSQIREVLIEEEVGPLSDYISTLYCDEWKAVPACWQNIRKPLSALAVES
ncbi:DUF7002 family protein [Paenibacillus sp. 1P07SE]|uniref:DUF7002 family protein n=1 Tax=Paenibacillus sp. 1P07SE TaxID=3132209 RepID=UPI0039A4C13E